MDILDTGPLRSVTPAIDIYIRLAQYPILSDKIRLRMREELFRRGVISQAEFEREVKELSIKSQILEGWGDSLGQEEESSWQRRKARIRNVHTDAYFASNLGGGLLDQIISETLKDQPASSLPDQLSFNPEISPWDMLFRQGIIYENLPLPQQEPIKHHLEEIKVVLIRRIMTDQLPFIGRAKKALSVADLQRVYRHLIGTGKIGGKSAGMLLAWKILQKSDPELGPDISASVSMPDSYFIGSEVIYEFIYKNGLEDHVNQKYRPFDEMVAMYPHIVEDFFQGNFSDKIVDGLRDYLQRTGASPIIVRSSSLLEDNFNYSFSGRYESYFCSNQGNEEENLTDLMNGIRRVFASIFNPEAMVDRQEHGLLDYDERMSVLLQKVNGQRYGRYFFPPVSGIAYSDTFSDWKSKIQHQDGHLKLVLGLSTRITKIDRLNESCLIQLSNPQRQLSESPITRRSGSQLFVDLINLETNQLQTLPIQKVLQNKYPYLAYVASLDTGNKLEPIQAADSLASSDRFILTFDYLIQDPKFIKLMRTALMRLEKRYKRPIEIEFALEIIPEKPTPNYKLQILQCRPLRQS